MIRGWCAERVAGRTDVTRVARQRWPRLSHGVLAALGGLAPTSVAYAHDLIGEAGLHAGFMHPLTGLDHLLAMVAVGMISVVLGGAAVWRVPTAFLLAMSIGAAAGYAGWRITHVEVAVAASVLLLGIALTLPTLAGWYNAVFGAVVIFGLSHGHAHGLELPSAAAPLQFSFGFLSASLFLHVCGLFCAEVLSKTLWQARLRQLIGACMAAAGVWFLAAAAGA